MEYAGLAALAVIIVIGYAISNRGGNDKPRAKTGANYQYSSKNTIMTAAEATFYRRLETVVENRYYIFPQIHLDALLDYTIKGQNWKGALSTIQRKSVDYVLCDRQTMKPVYAVELDDSTHDTTKRRARDAGVEKMLADVSLPLIRFRNVNNVTDEQIAQKFQDVAQI